jgi:streptogramin lyase
MKTLATLAGAAAAFALAAPAQAGIVGEAQLGSFMHSLVVGPDGGAWVTIERPGRGAVGRAGLDGSFRTTLSDEDGSPGVFGPDGKAWFRTGPATFLRADAGNALDTVRVGDSDDPVQDPFAIGADGTLWAPTLDYDAFWHITADGNRVRVPATFPKPCDTYVDYTDMVAAADGAMWLADRLCDRLIRVGPAGTTTVALDIDPEDLAADHAGGVWVSGSLEHSVLHVDAAGEVTPFTVPDEAYTDAVAVAPDGSAWFLAAACELLRVTETGAMTTSPTPIQADELGFDPAGGIWLKGYARLAHLAPGEPAAPCDRRAPKARISPNVSKLSLRRLRRRHEFTITVREPAMLEIDATYIDDTDHDADADRSLERIVRSPTGGTLRYRIPQRRIRTLERIVAAKHKARLIVSAVTTDLDGNPEATVVIARVTR